MSNLARNSQNFLVPSAVVRFMSYLSTFKCRSACLRQDKQIMQTFPVESGSVSFRPPGSGSVIFLRNHPAQDPDPFINKQKNLQKP